jgi:hypothetical protein
MTAASGWSRLARKQKLELQMDAFAKVFLVCPASSMEVHT